MSIILTKRMDRMNTKFAEQTEKYRENFQKYGHSEKSLFMPSDRRAVRYYELLKNFEFFQKGNFSVPVSICDAGCGFGDINGYLRALGMTNYFYMGLDVVEEFIEEGKKLYGSDSVSYIKRNFITDDISDLEFDYAVSSQTFTIPYSQTNENYEVIFSSIRKLFNQCRKGVAFNFFTDKGDVLHPGTAYHDPVKILDFAYTLSVNVVLDNSCFPYECTLTILKDNERQENGMIFDRFMRIHQQEFLDGTFVVKRK